MTGVNISASIPKPPAPLNIGQASILGLAWLLLQNIGGRAVNFLGQIVLAWLLNPADFGAIGIAYSITAVIAALAGFGIDEVLLSRQRTLRHWAAPAFWLSLGLSFGAGIAMLAAAPLAASIFKNPTIGSLVRLLALSLPFSALCSIPSVFLRSQLNFQFLSGYALGELAATQTLAVVLAYLGFGAFSFAIPVVVAAAVKAIVFWLLVRPAIKWRMRISQWRLLFSTGWTLFAQKFLGVVRNYGDYMVLGTLASSSTVGCYFFAFKVAAVPIYTLTASLGGVMLPALAQLRDDLPRQAAATVSASRILALVVMPLSFLQAAISESLLHLIFADKWAGAAALLQILSIGLAFDVVPCIAGSLMNANGRFSANLRWSLVVMPLFVAMIIAGGMLDSARGVALGVASFLVICAPSYSYYVLRECGCTVGEVMAIYLAPVACSALAATAGMAVIQLRMFRSNDFLAILVCTVITLFIYMLLIRKAAPAGVRELTARLKAICLHREARRRTVDAQSSSA